MQRRAAAVSVALFLLLAAGSYTLIGAAQQPAVSLEDPDYAVSEGEEPTIAGTSYNFSTVSEESATATWVNESARYTGTWAVNDTVAVDGQNFTVTGLNESQGVFELREVQTVDRPTVEQNGTTYVVIEDGANRTLVPRENYLPEQTVFEYQVGDTVEYDGNENETTVASVSDEEVVVEWFAPATNELEFSEGENTTIGETPYLAHFETTGPNQMVLQLTTDYQDYQSDVDAQEQFHERTNGLWGVVIMALLAAALVVMLAFLPSRY